jgi:hypothetical protein
MFHANTLYRHTPLLLRLPTCQQFILSIPQLLQHNAAVVGEGMHSTPPPLKLLLWHLDTAHSTHKLW